MRRKKRATAIERARRARANHPVAMAKAVRGENWLLAIPREVGGTDPRTDYVRSLQGGKRVIDRVTAALAPMGFDESPRDYERVFSGAAGERVIDESRPRKRWLFGGSVRRG